MLDFIVVFYERGGEADKVVEIDQSCFGRRKVQLRQAVHHYAGVCGCQAELGKDLSCTCPRSFRQDIDGHHQDVDPTQHHYH